MSARFRTDEQGFALVVCVIVLTILMAVGLGVAALADSQHAPTRDARAREAAQGLAEAALSAQVFQLSRIPWPGAAAAAPQAGCTAASAAGDSCPDAPELAAAFSQAVSGDYKPCATQPAWKTWVADNGTNAGDAIRTYYSTSGIAGQPAWDSNKDGILWVGATGYSSTCKSRTVVTQVKANLTQLTFPRNVITANWLQITGKKKAVVDSAGKHAQPKSIRPPKKQASAQAAAVQVRCAAPLPAGVTDPCLTYTKDQVKPPTGAKVTTLPTQMFTSAQIAGFAQLAQAAGTYYPAGTCPPNLTGAIVVVDDLTGCPSYAGGNDKDHPGFLVIQKGKLTLSGKGTYYGFIYHSNLGAVNTALVYLVGSAVIQGAVSVDGAGGVNPATKHTAIIFDPRGFSQPKVRTNAVAVPGSWRLLDPGQ
jgi:Tfp pilus assembly protein PilX